MPTPRPQPWADDAACTGQRDLFLATFPTLSEDATRDVPPAEPDVAAAREVCKACPVQPECLLYALEHRLDEGVWGGTTPDERETIRKIAQSVRESREDAA